MLIGEAPNQPVPSDPEGKITMGHFYSIRARRHAQALIGAPIELPPGKIDKLGRPPEDRAAGSAKLVQVLAKRPATVRTLRAPEVV